MDPKSEAGGAMKPALPRYRLLEAGFLQPARSVGPSRFEAGATVAFEGVPGTTMIPLNDPARMAVAASIRARGVGRLRHPPAGDRSFLTNLTKSIGGSIGTVHEMASQIEQWLAKFPPPQPDMKP
jgi:hypothetical protein